MFCFKPVYDGYEVTDFYTGGSADDSADAMIFDACFCVHGVWIPLFV